MPAIVENVVYQHAENVCSLWLQRQQAVEEPHYSFTDLVHLDNRLNANLEGMRVAGAHGLPFFDEMIDADDEGAVFGKALMAIERNDVKTFGDLMEQAEGNQEILIELDSALAWTTPDHLKGIVKMLLTNDSSAAFILGLGTCSSHNRNPGNYLKAGLKHNDVTVRAKTLRVGADVSDRTFGNSVLELTEFENDKEKFEAGRALAFCGQQSAGRKILGALTMSESKYAGLASDLIVQMDDPKISKALLKKLDATEGRIRDVVRGFGLLGDPVAMEWLITNTEVPELSRLCGGSISMITGIDLAMEDLETLDEPEGFEDPGPSDDPDDDNVLLDDDENLPWPAPELIRAWWDSSQKLPAGRFYLDGHEKDTAGLKHVLVNGMQRQRNAAAVGLALANPDSKYLDTRLPTAKQKVWMS